VDNSASDPERERAEHLQRARRREVKQRWRAATPEKQRQYRENAREWRRAYNATHRDKQLHQKREAEHRRRQRIKTARERVQKNRDRVRAWAAANPEKVRARKRAWDERNAERVREHSRAYYHRNIEQRREASREQNRRRLSDPQQREKQRQYQAANRERRNEWQRTRRADPAIRERENLEQNERRRIERRRRRLGLPPRPMRRATINERARNAEAAAAFNSRRWTAQEIRALQEELLEVQAEAARSSDEHHRLELAARIRADAEKPARIAAEIDRYLGTRAGAILREEVRMDSVARRARGARAYPSTDAEVRRRASAALEARRAALTTSARTSRQAGPNPGLEAPAP